MKKLLSVLALLSMASVNADQYYQQGNDYQNDNQNQQGDFQQPYSQNSYRYYQPQNVSEGNQQNSSNSYWGNQSQVQSSNSDQDISKKINATINSTRFGSGFRDVTFKVNNGNVRLGGTVDTLEYKSRIESIVRNIDGVREVNNQISINTESPDTQASDQMQNVKYSQDFAATPQDRQLNVKIREKLNGAWFSKGYDTFIIKTSNGVVVISGTVEKTDDVKKIGDQIKRVEGVKSVTNQLNTKSK